MEQPKQVSSHSQLEDTMDKLSYYCLYLTKNKWDSEEIVQEAMLKTLTKYKEEPFPPPVSLLKRIAYHAWIDRIRKQKNEQLVAEIKDIAGIEKKDTGQHEHLRKLTPKQLVVFILKEAFHYQAAEIAELLDVNVSAVKSLLRRARLNILSDTLHPLTDTAWEGLEQERILELAEYTLNDGDPAELIGYIPVLLRKSKTSYQPISNMCLAAA